ncbi:MAG: hypothetical protein AAGK14_11215 [Verrucomicrobiota bacterium]
MAKSQEESELRERREKAEKIAANPGDFKVCEGCESIVVQKAAFCPNCNSYRFDESAERVVEQAKVLGSRPSISLSARDFE